MKKAFQKYINNYKGFSKEIWILTIVTFINRAGTMVLPFLSKYLREDLAFTLPQVGWIMVSFGMGSMAGSWLGGKLSDKIGFYKIMVFSLAATGRFETNRNAVECDYRGGQLSRCVDVARSA